MARGSAWWRRSFVREGEVDGHQVRLVGPVDAGPVLDALVIALVVHGDRVDGGEEDVEDGRQVQTGGVVGDPDRLHVAGVGADLLVGRCAPGPLA